MVGFLFRAVIAALGLWLATYWVSGIRIDTPTTLVLAGILLGIWVAPAFLALSGFVGAGLMFAGLSGWCGMAKLLGLMPWNRRGPARAAA